MTSRLDTPTLEAAGRLLAGAYGAASFMFFVSSPSSTLDRALVHNALTDAEQRRLEVFLAVGVALATVWGVRAARASRDAFAATSYAAFLAAPLALWPLYEAVADLQVRLVSAAAIAALSGFTIHRFATRSPRGSLLDRLDAPSAVRVGGVIALAAGLAHGAAMAWVALAMGHGAIRAVQSVALGVAALPLYGIAIRTTRQTTLALLVTTGFLLHPCVAAIAEDPRPLPFALLLLGTTWAAITERTRLAAALFFVTLVARADAGLYLAVVSLYVLFEGKLVRPARWAFAVAAGWFAISSIASGSFDARLANPLSVIDAIVSQPDKWRFLALALMPVAFLPFVTPRGALLLLPALGTCLLGAVPEAWSIEHTDAAPLLALTFIGTIAGIARFRDSRMRTVLGVVVVVATVLVSAKFAREPLTNGPRVMRDVRARAGAL